MTRSTLLTALLSLLFAATLPAQDAPYRAALGAHLETLAAADGGGDPGELQAAGSAIARIAAAHPDAWLPSYYAARVALVEYYSAGDAGCGDCLERADAHLTAAEAADDNSEVMTLRASYYQAMLNEHPVRAPYYGPKAGNLLEAAAAADPTNPRAASLLGQNLFYTPAMFGGGEAKARPHLESAVALFAQEAADAERDALLPTWGAERAAHMLAEVTQ